MWRGGAAGLVEAAHETCDAGHMDVRGRTVGALSVDDNGITLIGAPLRTAPRA